MFERTVFHLYYFDDLFRFLCCQADTRPVTHPVGNFFAGRVKRNREGRTWNESTINIQSSQKRAILLYQRKISFQAV